ncbi:MAG: tRNA 2-thiouridine(34) synthase MnmA [Bacteroidota bacterium]
MVGKGRVLMAMSGGVDSSVTAILLREQGYELVGITMKTWDYASSGVSPKETGCCSLDSINDARSVAVKFDFPHYILDLRKEFEEKIISNFISEYIMGRTPNPCALCNKLVKWDYLLKKADQLNCEFIATGHYSQVIFENGRYFLRKGLDESKDQTYVLWGLSQEHLKRTLFPLGNYRKTDIKAMAKGFGIPRLANKRESYEICFIPDNDYRSFLKNRVEGLEQRVDGGNFVLSDGKIFGKHHGYPFYTIGQRKGLEVAVGHPLYVKSIDAANNLVELGVKDELLKLELVADGLNLMKYTDFSRLEHITTKIRYKDSGAGSVLTKLGDTVHVVFDKAVSAITPGQSAVFYDGLDVVGGGIII